MPPKRKAAGGKGAGGKKAKAAPKSTPATLKDAAAALKAEDKKVGGKKSHKVDGFCPLHSAQVVEDYDCMLNQTNIGANNNKFYVIQVLSNGAVFYSWNRWGRVGENGANALKGPMDKAGAIKDFEKKFRDKTKNAWGDRGSFKPVPGKYTLIEMADEDEDVVDAPVPAAGPSLDGKKVAECTLDKPTQALIKLIFDNDMFKDTMAKFDIDVKKMPLGKLSKGQIAKGFEVLDEIELELKANRKTKLNELSSRFYTVIPHNFGRLVPPIINNMEMLRQKMDMLLVLGDIEIAQSLQKEKDKQMDVKGDVAPNPYDVNYELLKCGLKHVPKTSKEYKIIEKYTSETAGGWRNPKIKEVWCVDRHGEDARFSEHDKIGNRRLLWHGTSVAVVAAILKSGLRIMPHSGGRVGSGIYFASENSKSACYVGTLGKTGIMFLNEVVLVKQNLIQRDDSSLKAAPKGYDSVFSYIEYVHSLIEIYPEFIIQVKRVGTVGKTGIMFLNEVVLGKQNLIQRDDSSLKAAPKGYDSVLAQGRTEPDPKNYTQLKFGKHLVDVPQSKPVPNPGCQSSSFSQSEYLIYKESQNRIRYLLLMEF